MILGELRRGVIKGELAIIYCAFECSCVCVINYRLGTLPLLVSEISLLGPSWRALSPFFLGSLWRQAIQIAFLKASHRLMALTPRQTALL